MSSGRGDLKEKKLFQHEMRIAGRHAVEFVPLRLLEFPKLYWNFGKRVP